MNRKNKVMVSILGFLLMGVLVYATTISDTMSTFTDDVNISGGDKLILEATNGDSLELRHDGTSGRITTSTNDVVFEPSSSGANTNWMRC